MTGATRRTTGTLAGLAVAVAGAAALGLALGPVRIGLADVVRALAGGGADPVVRQVVLEVRLPRVIMGSAVGALLAVAGVLLQGFLRNPLAEPYLLGVSSGAALAVTLAILTGVPLFVAGLYALPFVAFAGALLALGAVWWLASAHGRLQVTTLVLAGVVVSAILSALIMLVASRATAEYFEVMSWLMGHLQPATAGVDRWVAAWAVAGTCLGWREARDLNALLAGEESAAALGVDAAAVKRRLFLLASLLTGAAVAVSGLIGFVGLIAPHLTRLLLGPDHRRLVPGAALAGAAMLLLADLVARLAMAPAELPVGVVTALVGGPFFLFLLVRHLRGLEGTR